MNPARSLVRKACLQEAINLWKEQPSLGLLETINEIRVAIRGSRDSSIREVPGVETIRQWLVDAIASGEIRGRSEMELMSSKSRSRRQGQ